MAFVRWILLMGFVAVTSLSAQEQRQAEEPAPKGYRYESGVRIIPVPTFVTDDDGNPVTDLTEKDFVIKEEGKERPIALFQKVDYEQLSIDRQQGRLGPLPPSMRRQFLLLFDLTFSSSRGLLRARESATAFMDDRLLPEDLISVATYSSVGGLKLLTNFSTDRVHARYMIATLGLEQSTHIVQDPVGFVFSNLLTLDIGPDAAPRQLRDFEAMIFDHMRTISLRMQRSDEDAYRAHASQYFGQFATLNAALRSMSGRKYILLFSEGVDSRFVTGTGVTTMDADFEAFIGGHIERIDPENRHGRSDLRDSLQDGLREAAAADTVIHTFDVSGLGGDLSDRVDASGNGRDAMQPGTGAGGGQDTLFMMADETGGHFFKNLNSLEEPLQRVLNETRYFYLLAFEPRDLKQRGRYRKIKVEVKRRDVNVSARRGYYEPNTPDKLVGVEKNMKVAEYVSKDILSDDVSFDVLLATYPGQGSLAKLPVFIQFPGKQFLEGERKAKDVLELEIYGYAIAPDGEFVDFFNKDVAFDLKKDRARLESHGIKYYDLLFAEAGDVRVKLVVRDKGTGLIGSFIEDVDVPDFGGNELAMTPPLFMQASDDWVTIRGFDPLNPEERRQGLPVSYPFRAEGQEFIPSVRPSFDKSEPSFMMVRVYNLQLHPDNGQPQTEMKFERIDRDWTVETIRDVGLAKPPEQPEVNCFELVFQIDWAEVTPGPGLFQLSLTDSMAKRTVQGRSAYRLEN